MNILLGINAVLLIVLIISCSKESIQSFIAKHKQAKKLHSTDENRNKVFSTNEGENIFILSENNNKVSFEYFKNKDSIKSIHFYNPNTEIDTATFTGCESLTDIKLPQNLKEIKPLTFAYCKNLQTIEIPKSVEKISTGAFLHCENLCSIELNCGEIKTEAFSACSCLKIIKFENHVKKIEKGAFKDCKNFHTIIIPNKHIRIAVDDNAFEGIREKSVKIETIKKEEGDITKNDIMKILNEKDLSRFPWLEIKEGK